MSLASALCRLESFFRVQAIPQVMSTPVNRDEDFIEVPSVAGAGTATAQAVGINLAELEIPVPDSLIS